MLVSFRLVTHATGGQQRGWLPPHPGERKTNRTHRKNGHTLREKWSTVFLRTTEMGWCLRSSRFKPIQGRFNLGRSLESPSSVRVLIYDQSGAIIMQKDFEVTSS